ncbi:TMAO reductase system periplasmic protein TorT [Thalassomonas haliotis]|uniref:TMAO reductase system periplasmic protein TorT n=1 Tax=Thalassomonas haliotis TaxID=485448 RepID=A0ABY7VGA6_9GAMM|nr:TMAO reductase system periplasmic protein TorT [Thalassomonas haliotis]WDE12457.1 TMAO reductase system periplasmic protein TorT [Thalassomonas haliotis]
MSLSGEKAACAPANVKLLLILLLACYFPLSPAFEAKRASELLLDGKSDDNMTYTWLRLARKPWRLCAIVPVLDTSYWFSINYGLSKQARELGISLKIFQIGAFAGADKQRAYLDLCRKSSEGIILGGVYDQSEKGKVFNVPVIAVGYPVKNVFINANVIPRASESGKLLAEHLNRQTENKALEKLKVGLFPGPENSLFAQQYQQGFLARYQREKISLLGIHYTRHEYEEVQQALSRFLNQNLDLDVLVTSGYVAEIASDLLKRMSLEEEVTLLSLNLTAQVYREMKRGSISGAITASPVLQGKLAVDMAVKLLEKKRHYHEATPKLKILTRDTLDDFDHIDVFAPYGYKEILEVN